MTDVEFYDYVIAQTGYLRGKEFGSAPYLSVIYNGEEFRIKYRKRYGDVRLVYIHARKTDARFIDRYEINPPSKSNGKEGSNNLSIYKDTHINSQAEVDAVINWIKTYIPKMYNELS